MNASHMVTGGEAGSTTSSIPHAPPLKICICTDPTLSCFLFSLVFPEELKHNIICTVTIPATRANRPQSRQTIRHQHFALFQGKRRKATPCKNGAKQNHLLPVLASSPYRLTTPLATRAYAGDITGALRNHSKKRQSFAYPGFEPANSAKIPVVFTRNFHFSASHNPHGNIANASVVADTTLTTCCSLLIGSRTEE